MNVIINYFSLFVVEKPWSALQKVRPGKEKEADALKEKKAVTEQISTQKCRKEERNEIQKTLHAQETKIVCFFFQEKTCQCIKSYFVLIPEDAFSSWT